MHTTSFHPSSPRRRWAVLAVCCLSLLLVSLDVTIVNVALPRISTGLHASLSGLQWTIDAYALVLASLLMASGALADRHGRRRVFAFGLSLFAIGSLLCSLAPSLGWLVAFRIVQAVGGSMLNPVAMAIVVNTFTDARERAQAIGIWAAVVGVSMALGPVAGGALVSAAGWRSIFWVNIPIAGLALVLARRLIPESRAARPRAVDPIGQSLVIILLGVLVYAIIDAPAHGWDSARTLGLFAVAACAAAALAVAERRAAEPLLETRFFASVPFSAAAVSAVAAFAALGAFLFINTLYLQDVRGYSPAEAGLRTLPMAVMAGLCAPLSGRVLAARGARFPLVLAGLATAAGAVLLLGLSARTGAGQLLVAYAFIGIGFGLVNAPITNAATSGMPRARAGVAAAIASTSRQVGMSLGVAISGSLVAGASAPALSGASHVVWAMVAGLGLSVAALGILATGRWGATTGARVAQRIAAEEQYDRAERGADGGQPGKKVSVTSAAA